VQQWRTWFALTCAVTLGLSVAQPACARQNDDPFEALRTGRYQQAIAGLERLARQPGADLRTQRAYVWALLETGKYDQAVQHISGISDARTSIELANLLGDALRERGRTAEAQQAYRKSVDGKASDALSARVSLAAIDYERGRRDAALSDFDRFIDVYNGAEKLSPDDLTAVATAVSYLGVRQHNLFQDAKRAYEEAIAADGTAPGLPAQAFEPRIRLGNLFLDKYNSTDAQDVFGEVLSVNPQHARALLGMAAAKYFDGTPEAMELVQSSLETNPDYAPARVFRGRLLADLEKYDEAIEEVERALATNPESLEALSVLAGIHYVRGDQAKFEQTRQRAFALDPTYADFYNGIAELAVRQRQYAAAVQLAQQAAALDPQSWWGWGIMGLNQLRTGQLADAKKNLDIAFAGDPYNPWIKNTLDLMDTFKDYQTIPSERFAFMLHKDEAEILNVYAAPLAEEAYTKLAERYGYRVQTPVRVEVYPSHADFSVRTVGLAGLGALGVAFGNNLAMDAPSARDRDPFNWGSTLWHEITHAFTLGATDHRVPRWLTEGLSVLEERRARPGWGDDISLEWLAAYKVGAINPVSRLNEGFVRPKFPAQVGLSYYQASIVAELIEKEHGFAAIQGMLRGYREGKNDETVFREVLKISIEDFDKRFDAYVKERFGRTLAAIKEPSGPRDSAMARMMRLPEVRGEPAPDDLFAQIATAGRLFEEKKYDEAIPYYQRVKQLFPEYAGGNSPYRALAVIYLEKGQTREAAAELSRHVALDETDYESNRQLADILEKLGDTAGAAAALERAIYISPYDMALHAKFAEMAAARSDWKTAIRERRAVLALRPVDRPEALYQLALAYFNGGDRTNARREILKALEAAPNFVKAQELLVKLQGGQQ
jgi:tetratricopeptide (TPR) repeat protein